MLGKLSPPNSPNLRVEGISSSCLLPSEPISVLVTSLSKPAPHHLAVLPEETKTNINQEKKKRVF